MHYYDLKELFDAGMVWYLELCKQYTNIPGAEAPSLTQSLSCAKTAFLERRRSLRQFRELDEVADRILEEMHALFYE